jgi:transcriptional regulator
VPDHFRPSDADVAALLANLGAAELITSTADGLLATYLPLLYETPATTTSPDDGALMGRLMGHVARNNRQWKTATIGEALVIARGPDAYISPSWYATKQEHGRVVPTWNYVTAHIHGRLIIHDERDWLERNVRALTGRHEAGREPAWSVDDAPAEYVEGQLRAIVGVEIVISRIEAKLKLSQNRSRADVEGAIAGLEATGTPGSMATATDMRSTEEARGRS